MSPGLAQGRGGACRGSPAAGKASSCTRALSTASFGVSAPKGEWWGADGPNQLLWRVAEILEPYVPAAWAAWSCLSAWVSWLQLIGVFIPPGWQLNVLSTHEAGSCCDNLSACSKCSPGPLSTVTQLFPMEDAVPALSKPVTGRPKRQSEALSRKCADPSPCCPTEALLTPSQAATPAANARRGVPHCMGRSYPQICVLLTETLWV